MIDQFNAEWRVHHATKANSVPSMHELTFSNGFVSLLRHAAQA
jgi:hypothetical protein